MSRIAKAKPKGPISTSHAQRVGAAEFRGNLAKYLKQAKAGTPVIIQERGRSAYVLSRFEEGPKLSAFGCMRERTQYTAGAVVNASEPWPPGGMP
jgi:prevent-host-death family protein